MNRHIRTMAVAAALLATGAGAATTVAGCKGPRLNALMMSKSQEVEVGQQTAVEVERKYAGKVLTSGPHYDRLQRVAARILPQAAKDYDVPYTVKVIQSKDINAFALPGGPIYFYTGLIDLAATDDELASVLGHEASHISKRHSAKQIADAQTKGILAQIALGRASDIAQVAAGIALQLDQLSFSRGDESQADEVGFKYLVNAGYDPDAMASFFMKMGEAAGGGGGPQWLSSHPLTGERVRKAQERANAYKKEQTSTR
ncbi:MAG TPA: M48 family metallopeptidase [Armatimonadaceae bacterium]|nr:M48 family metallopeptidase [Armatimonadaceae bacterium]